MLGKPPSLITRACVVGNGIGVVGGIGGIASLFLVSKYIKPLPQVIINFSTIGQIILSGLAVATAYGFSTAIAKDEEKAYIRIAFIIASMIIFNAFYFFKDKPPFLSMNSKSVMVQGIFHTLGIMVLHCYKAKASALKSSYPHGLESLREIIVKAQTLTQSHADAKVAYKEDTSEDNKKEYNKSISVLNNFHTDIIESLNKWNFSVEEKQFIEDGIKSNYEIYEVLSRKCSFKIGTFTS